MLASDPRIASLTHKSIIRLESYLKEGNEIVVGYSGGKDSSALLKLIIKAVIFFGYGNKVVAVYCDTGVDIPIINAYVKKTLKNIKDETAGGLCFEYHLVSPSINEGFLVKSYRPRISPSYKQIPLVHP